MGALSAGPRAGPQRFVCDLRVVDPPGHELAVLRNRAFNKSVEDVVGGVLDEVRVDDERVPVPLLNLASVAHRLDAMDASSDDRHESLLQSSLESLVDAHVRDR